MIFKKYPKIHRLGKEETDGILEDLTADDNIVVQEKLDGANTSIWMDADGVVQCGSRTRQLPADESFNGFTKWARSQESVVSYLTAHPASILYGEWLVRHTIQYSEASYQKWYLFDIYDQETFLAQAEVKAAADEYGFNHPQVFAEGILNKEQILEYVGKTNLGEEGEGVVIKRAGWTNQFGDHTYAKVVTQKFTENNAVTFGGNNKHSDTYQEMRLVNKFCTLSRVEKIMNKIQPEIEKRLDLEHIPRIINTCYHDMITEEGWSIAGENQVIDFKQLRRLANKKFIQMYKDKILGTASVADRQN